MGVLLLIQYFSNNYLAKLQYNFFTIADSRIDLISQVVRGIRSIKCRILENFYGPRVEEIRAKELKSFSLYCDVKNICSAIYFNAGVIISALVFLIVDKDSLELGKVFSTLALLGYIFNFSICYSNYAIESLYALQVFNKRIEDVITSPLMNTCESRNVEEQALPLNSQNVLELKDVTTSWKTPSEQSPEDDDEIVL